MTRTPTPEPDAAAPPAIDPDEAVARLAAARDALTGEIRKAIVGQEEVIDQLLIAMLARGHALLVGVPGLAKTLLVSSLAKTLSLSYKRIQFTPDLMPSDITGTEILQDDPAAGERRFRFIPGPVFASIVLGDEINRTPPKTQAALLEAMQERRVSFGGVDYPLDEPFFVLATQNPIEQEGTYPLPEAQLDRFIFNIRVDYPTFEEEIEIMTRAAGSQRAEPAAVLSREEILALQQSVCDVEVDPRVVEYAATLVRSTRPEQPDAPDFIRDLLAYGAGPRAGLNLVLGAKARALLRGRSAASFQDIAALTLPVLRHRIIPSFAARSEGLSADDIAQRLLRTIPPE